MKDLLGLEESGTFEQMEKMVSGGNNYNDPKGIFNVQDNQILSRNTYRDETIDGKDSLDLTGLETLKRISGKEEAPNKPKQDQPKANPNVKGPQKQQVFDCDVSEIKQNRYFVLYLDSIRLDLQMIASLPICFQ